MIAGPLAPDLSAPAIRADGERGLSARMLGLLGVALIGLAVVGVVAWAIFVSPLGFTRYSLAERDRTFTIHRAGTYVVYFEYPDESRSALPPALDIGVASLSGQAVDVQPVGSPGVAGAPDAYDLWHYEGRAVALIHAREAGTFVVSIDPTPAAEVDTSQQRIITEGTIALGRDWSRTWLASWFGFAVVSMVPVGAGIALLILGWRRREEPEPTDSV